MRAATILLLSTMVLVPTVAAAKTDLEKTEARVKKYAVPVGTDQTVRKGLCICDSPFAGGGGTIGRLEYSTGAGIIQVQCRTLAFDAASGATVPNGVSCASTFKMFP